jgi:hypothetical protein
VSRHGIEQATIAFDLLEHDDSPSGVETGEGVSWRIRIASNDDSVCIWS